MTTDSWCLPIEPFSQPPPRPDFGGFIDPPPNCKPTIPSCCGMFVECNPLSCRTNGGIPFVEKQGGKSAFFCMNVMKLAHEGHLTGGQTHAHQTHKCLVFGGSCFNFPEASHLCTRWGSTFGPQGTDCSSQLSLCCPCTILSLSNLSQPAQICWRRPSTFESAWQ